MEGYLGPILRGVAVKNLWSEARLEQVNFHKREETVFLETKPVGHNLQALLQLVCFQLLISLALNDIDVVNWLFKPLPLNGHAQGLVWLGRTREA